jgi:hypothetical protein
LRIFLGVRVPEGRHESAGWEASPSGGATMYSQPKNPRNPSQWVPLRRRLAVAQCYLFSYFEWQLKSSCGVLTLRRTYFRSREKDQS